MPEIYLQLKRIPASSQFNIILQPRNFLQRQYFRPGKKCQTPLKYFSINAIMKSKLHIPSCGDKLLIHGMHILI